MAAQPLRERSLEDAISRAPGWSLRPPYEHFVQAGSLPDCFKHVVLVLLLQDMLSTESPIVYVDTHAGAGMYDLDTQKARLHRRVPPVGCRVCLVRSSGHYRAVEVRAGLAPSLRERTATFAVRRVLIAL